MRSTSRSFALETGAKPRPYAIMGNFRQVNMGLFSKVRRGSEGMAIEWFASPASKAKIMNLMSLRNASSTADALESNDVLNLRCCAAHSAGRTPRRRKERWPSNCDGRYLQTQPPFESSPAKPMPNEFC